MHLTFTQLRRSAYHNIPLSKTAWGILYGHELLDIDRLCVHTPTHVQDHLPIRFSKRGANRKYVPSYRVIYVDGGGEYGILQVLSANGYRYSISGHETHIDHRVSTLHLRLSRKN